MQIVSHFEAKVIPFYSAQLKTWEHSLKPVKPLVNFCMIFQTNNSFRIEINASEIQSF
jgi:hypothetical protein